MILTKTLIQGSDQLNLCCYIPPVVLISHVNSRITVRRKINGTVRYNETLTI